MGLGRVDRVKILLVGSGAREHALARTLGQDPAVTALHALPGNPGIGSVVSTAGMPTVLHQGNPLDPKGVTALAVELGVDLVVIGFLHLRLDTLARVLGDVGGWLRPGGHLVYLGHAAENLSRGVGGPQDPTVLPGIADLARGAEGLEVVSLRHDLRPAGKATAVDVLLHARSWVRR